ncbi:flagellar protein FlgN [Desulfobulbus oligotrophicus]|uniref:Flagellar protein FlgN n=1 Tax=Desulfobulbus oligotrophicus TaxID=1909699 RepID=A0A7T6AQY9_9BACT|nr:flagellar protein FlgN [Desulfobulbus oligotrophicus]MDY0389347.1 flagellar protein FlgN [Desulfobulbus oligotrophicus]QQG66005.1 flagellar protein FlgN [Desulfobulbus oligotrophicus]
MERETVRMLLTQLRDTIRQEREHAKALDINAMLADVKRKEGLLHALSGVTDLHPDDRLFAQEIRQENRRNAYLFRATLNWIQETMEFFGRKTVPVTYSQHARSQDSIINGRLLSGRV